MQKRRIFSAAFLIILTSILAIAIIITVLKIPIIHAQYYKYSPRPDDSVSEFLIALNENDLILAKEFVVLGMRERIDQWEVVSGHKASPCLWSDLIEPYAGGGGSGGTEPRSNKATFNFYYFGCHSGNQASITISDVTLLHDLGGWLITGWNKICIASNTTSETCY